MSSVLQVPALLRWAHIIHRCHQVHSNWCYCKYRQHCSLCPLCHLHQWGAWVVLFNLPHLIPSVPFQSLPPIHVEILLLALSITAFTLITAVVCHLGLLILPLLISLYLQLQNPVLNFQIIIPLSLWFVGGNLNNNLLPFRSQGGNNVVFWLSEITSNHESSVFPSSSHWCTYSLALYHCQYLSNWYQYINWSYSHISASSISTPIHSCTNLVWW